MRMLQFGMAMPKIVNNKGNWLMSLTLKDVVKIWRRDTTEPEPSWDGMALLWAAEVGWRALKRAQPPQNTKPS